MKGFPLVMVAALVVVGCGGDDETEWDGPTIPLGTYRKITSVEEVEADWLAAGVSQSTITEALSLIEPVDGEIHMAFRIDDGRYEQFGTWRGDHDAGASRGVFTYSEEGEWVLTDDRCDDEPCTYELTWTYANDVLTVDPESDGVEVRDFLGGHRFHYIFSGAYEKVGEPTQDAGPDSDDA